MTKTITNDPNLQHTNNPNMPHLKPSSTVEQAKLQEAARTTVVDASDRVTQMEGAGYGAINRKASASHVYSEAESANIRQARITSVATSKNNSSPTGK